MFDIVIQQNKIVTMKYGGLAFLRANQRRLPLVFDCHSKWRAFELLRISRQRV